MKLIKENSLVGLSYARSYKELARWKLFLDELNVKYCISDMDLRSAAEVGDKVFRYAADYCFTRRATLGEYINLVENKQCIVLLTASRYVEGNVKCNTIRFVPTQIAEHYRDRDITVLDACISTREEIAKKQLMDVAKYFSEDKDKIEEAASKWLNYKSQNKKTNIEKGDKITIFIFGSAPFHLSCNSAGYMNNFLTDKLGVYIVDAKNASEIKNSKCFRKAYKLLNHNNLLNTDRQMYWERPTVLSAFFNVMDEVFIS